MSNTDTTCVLAPLALAGRVYVVWKNALRAFFHTTYTLSGAAEPRYTCHPASAAGASLQGCRETETSKE